MPSSRMPVRYVLVLLLLHNSTTPWILNNNRNQRWRLFSLMLSIHARCFYMRSYCSHTHSHTQNFCNTMNPYAGGAHLFATPQARRAQRTISGVDEYICECVWVCVWVALRCLHFRCPSSRARSMAERGVAWRLCKHCRVALYTYSFQLKNHRRHRSRAARHNKTVRIALHA